MKSVLLLPLLLLVLALVWSGDSTSPNAANYPTPVLDAALPAANCTEPPATVAVVADGVFEPCAEELQ